MLVFSIVSFIGLHRNRKHNIHKLILIQGNSSIQIHRILLHLKSDNLDNRASFNEVIQVEETLMVFIQIEENQIDNTIMEAITHLDKGISEFVIIHAARMITIEKVVRNLWMIRHQRA